MNMHWGGGPLAFGMGTSGLQTASYSGVGDLLSIFIRRTSFSVSRCRGAEYQSIVSSSSS